MAAADRPAPAGVSLSPLFAHSDRVMLATPAGPEPRLSTLVHAERAAIDAVIDRTGGILFRGFGVDEAGFAETVAALCTPLPYLYRSTPRTELGGGVYT